MQFGGKIVIVTGAAQGIGKCVAETYAQEGATVIAADINAPLGEETVDQINANGNKAIFIHTDVANPSDIERLIESTVEQFGRIDILINNTGIGCWKSPYELSVEEWDTVINTNLRSTFLCSREAAKAMKQHEGGSIVNIASTRAFMSEPNSEAYAATKGGIVALTHALAASFAPDHIQVNCISPGWIETREYDQLRNIDHTQHFSQRVGKPEDIARACLFLTNPVNNFINGTNLTIDGGMTKKMIYEP
jgi:NAD(P)-dependent dehydrogenase (short-subunit alcohol dehydrogenase family)